MIAWLLARPRLIAYGLAGAAILGAGGLAWWRVSAWHSAYQERPEIEKRIKAVERERDDAIRDGKAVADALVGQVAANRRIEDDTTTRTAAADAAARDLARRLQLSQARAAAADRAAATAAGDLDAARRVARDREAIGRAAEEHFAACSKDAERLTGLQTYVRALPKRCVPD